MESKHYQKSVTSPKSPRVSSVSSLSSPSPRKQLFKSALGRSLQVQSLEHAMPNQSTPVSVKKFQKDINMDFEFHCARKSLDYMEIQQSRMSYMKNLNEFPEVQEQAQGGDAESIRNIFLEGEVDKLKWQLELMENNRDMYHALMKEMTNFLQRCSEDLNDTQSDASSCSSGDMSGQRSPSMCKSGDSSDDFAASQSVASYNKYKEYYNNRSSKRVPNPPASVRIAKEAFRLLRTAQNLMNTREPDLRQAPSSPVMSDRRSSIGFQKSLRRPNNTPMQSPLKNSLRQSNSDLFWDKIDCDSSRLSLPLMNPVSTKEPLTSSTEDEGFGGSVRSVQVTENPTKTVKPTGLYRHLIAKQSLLKRISSMDLMSKK